MSPDFTPLSAMAGGALIGLAASMMLWMNGRIAGISGIYGGLLDNRRGDLAWRFAFVLGLVGAGAVMLLTSDGMVAATDSRSVVTTAIAGLLVGFGVRLGSGCTSGHGVCGLTRFSRRSIVATLTFMGTGMATASAIQFFGGGAL